MKLLTLRKNPNNELLVEILPNELLVPGCNYRFCRDIVGCKSELISPGR